MTPHSAAPRRSWSLVVAMVAATGMLVVLLPSAGVATAASLPGTLGASVAPALGAEEPRLGSRRHYAPYGKGWGRVSPRVVFNGGAPSGLAKRILWRDWGAERSIGHGRIAIYRPEGGYYSRLGRVSLRAQRLDSCGRRPAYTRLAVRVADRPGEPVSGPWRPWAGGGTLCR